MSDVRQVAHLVELGRDREAAVLAGQLLGQAPHDGDLLRWAGLAHLRLDEPGAALQLLDAAVAADPHDAEAHRMRSFALLDQGDRPQAEAAAREGVRLAPADAAQHEQLATTMRDDPMRIEEARRTAENAVRLAPHRADSHFTLGLVCRDRWPSVAARAYREALRLDPQHAGAMNNLALIEHPRSSMRRLRTFGSVLSVDPQSSAARANLTGILDRLAWGWLVGVVVSLRAAFILDAEWLIVPILLVWVGVAVVYLRRLPRGVRRFVPDVLLPRRHRARPAFVVLTGGLVVLVASIVVDALHVASLAAVGEWGFGVGVLLAGLGAVLAALRMREEEPR